MAPPIRVNNLRHYRRALGYTQAELAERAEISFPYVQLLERGASDPTLSVARRVAAALGVPLDRVWEEAEEVLG